MKRRNIIWLMLSLLFMSFGCGKKSENKPDGSLETYSIESKDLDLSKSSLIVTLPAIETNYVIQVKASSEVKWRAYIESGDLVTVSPMGEQKGDGTITITKNNNLGTENSSSKVVIERLGKIAEKRIIEFKKSNKVLYIPEGTEGQSVAQFNNPASKYNVHYMVESENVAVFWEKSFGVDPRIAQRKFDQNSVLKGAEEVYTFLTGTLGFGSLPNSYSEKYKILIFVRNNDDGGATGGGNGNVGMLWVAPPVLQNPRFGILYHEMGHCFQAIARFDGSPAVSGPIHEMTSQFTLLQKFPNWGELEYGHLDAYVKETHLALGHEINGYRDAYMLEYWTNFREPKIVSRIWQEALASDNTDFVTVYKRLAKLNQDEFNNERFEAARRFVTWDIPSIKDTYSKYINLHGTKLKNITGKTYQITPERCPQNYGYNVIKLNVPAAGSKLQLNFQGVVGVQGFNVVNPEKQGWRYGFVALKKDKTRVYGDIGKATQGAMEFTVPADTDQLWFVVSGAPTEHWKHVVDSNPATDNQWPYQFTLLGTEPHSSNF